jgi:hypothetical protein
MNQYTELLYYIKQIGDADPFVNTITQGDFDELDLDKANIFPLLHVNITGAGFTNGQTVTFNVQIGCFGIRDINKNVNADKFWLNDNEVDNLNETLSTLNRLWSKMYKNFDDNNITSTENPSLEPVTEYGTNLLDGWIMTFDVELPNTTLSLCEVEILDTFDLTFDLTFN